MLPQRITEFDFHASHAYLTDLAKKNGCTVSVFYDDSSMTGALTYGTLYIRINTIIKRNKNSFFAALRKIVPSMQEGVYIYEAIGNHSGNVLNAKKLELSGSWVTIDYHTLLYNLQKSFYKRNKGIIDVFLYLIALGGLAVGIYFGIAAVAIGGVIGLFLPKTINYFSDQRHPVEQHGVTISQDNLENSRIEAKFPSGHRVIIDQYKFNKDFHKIKPKIGQPSFMALSARSGGSSIDTTEESKDPLEIDEDHDTDRLANPSSDTDAFKPRRTSSP